MSSFPVRETSFSGVLRDSVLCVRARGARGGKKNDKLTDAPHLQIGRYVVVGCLAAGLEAFSVQNDNLTLPLYMWAMLVLGDVVVE